MLTGLALGLCMLSVGGHLLRLQPHVDPAQRIDPLVLPDAGYVGSDVCRSCHPYQHATWHASYHRTMTQVATPEAVRAPFDGTRLSLEGVQWTLEERDGAFEVFGVEPRPGRGDTLQLRKRVVMTTGSHNYQMYWLEADPDGGMAPFPLVYLLDEGIWIPRKSRFLSPPRDRTPLETGRWDVHCIKCHATHGRPRPTDADEPRVAELGISCEACHGPGGAHVRRNHSPRHRFLAYASDDADTTIVNPRRLSHERSTQVCAQCHSIEIFLSSADGQQWLQHGSSYRPGDDLSRHQTTVVGRYEDNPADVQRYLDEHETFRLRNCFWPDGMLRVTGREYHGMLESPCYQRGEMSCLSCHRLHRSRDDARPFEEWAEDQLGAGMRGDGACLQCHPTYADGEQLTGHTHHALESSGSRCTNCHMSYTTWGLLGAIRSHTVDSPDVAVSITTGRPNACNQCHLDRTLSWTARTLHGWYDIPEPDMSEDERTVAASILWSLSGDAVQRALMAWSMGWEPARRVSGSQWMVPYLATLLADPYDAVRYNAQRTLRSYPEYRTLTADSLRGATKDQQNRMMQTILVDWARRFPSQADRSGPAFLIRADARVDRSTFARLAAQRNDRELVLFE